MCSVCRSRWLNQFGTQYTYSTHECDSSVHPKRRINCTSKLIDSILEFKCDSFNLIGLKFVSFSKFVVLELHFLFHINSFARVPCHLVVRFTTANTMIFHAFAHLMFVYIYCRSVES